MAFFATILASMDFNNRLLSYLIILFILSALFAPLALSFDRIFIGLINIPSLYLVIYLLFINMLGYSMFLRAYISISLSTLYPMWFLRVCKSI